MKTLRSGNRQIASSQWLAKMFEIDRNSDMTGPPQLGSLPYLRLKSKAGGVFGDGSFDLVGCAGWKFCVDFDCDVQRCIGVAGEKGDDFFGDLNQSHF